MSRHVIVVGAGPVGLMLASELRVGGARVTVVDRLATPTTESRASTLHARTMEIFDQRGLLGWLGMPPNEPRGHFGGIPLDLGGQDSRYPGQWKVGQTRVEEMLAGWAGGLGVDIRRGHELVDLTVADDRVTAHLIGPAGPVELTGGYLVGCDGENSTVRRLVGDPFPGRDATRELLRADVAGIDIPNRRFERLPTGLAIAARRPDGVTRVMVCESDRLIGHRVAPPEFEDVVKAWQRVTGEDISDGTPIWVNAFDNTSRLAQRYRHGRVLLAGDAAHRQMPIGGQAINLGIQDAVNLGWKLATVVAGHAGDELLDSYHAERHAVGQRVLGNIEAQAQLLLGTAAVEPLRAVFGELIGYSAVRDRLAAMVSGLDVRYGTGGHPLVGARFPHVELQMGTVVTTSTALLRPARGVLLDLSADPDRRSWLRDLMDGWAGRVGLVSSAPVPGTAMAGLDTLLLRPDGYVAWVSDQRGDPRPAMDTWFGPGGN